MTFTLPSIDQLRRIGADLGMEITTDYAQELIEYIEPFAEGYRMIAAEPDELPAVKYPRGPAHRPTGDENKYGAWLVKAPIKGAETGKLAGKTFAVKDTYCVAGLPLTNGASVLKNSATHVAQTRAELTLEIFGHQGLGWEGDAFAKEELDTVRGWLSGKAMSIYGGSFEIQNNIISKRILGLPDNTQSS